jgi:hypothetical protein
MDEHPTRTFSQVGPLWQTLRRQGGEAGVGGCGCAVRGSARRLLGWSRWPRPFSTMDIAACATGLCCLSFGTTGRARRSEQAGIGAPCSGAYVLRHTLATTMVRPNVPICAARHPQGDHPTGSSPANRCITAVRGCLSPLLNLSEKSYVAGFQRVVDPKGRPVPFFFASHPGADSAPPFLLTGDRGLAP